MRAVVAVAASVAVAVGALAGVAAGAPINAKNAFPVRIVCPSGTYTAVVMGNGDFTAAHSVTSNTVLVPVSFGPFTGTFTDAEGNTFTETDPPLAKGAATPANGRLETCTYFVEFSGPEGTFSGSGTVTGFVPGR